MNTGKIIGPGLLPLAILFFTSCYVGVIETEKPLSIGLIADVQYCPCEPNLTRHYDKSLGKLNKAMWHFKTLSPAFIVTLGDLIEKEWENFPPVLETFTVVDSPIYHVLGNHDYEIRTHEKDTLTRLLNMPHHFYQVTRGGWRFIMLDGNDLSFHATPANSPKIAERDTLYNKTLAKHKPQAKTWNGGISFQQLSWLRSALKSAQLENQKVMLFSHYPIYPPNLHNLWNDTEVLDVVKEHDNVKAFISGHNHQGFYEKAHGIHFLGLKAMVELPLETSYAMLHIYNDSLVVKGYGREISRYMGPEKPAPADTVVKSKALPIAGPQSIKPPADTPVRKTPAPPPKSP